MSDKYFQMMSPIFCDITSCSPLKVIRRFGGTYRLHLKDRGISPARYQREVRDNQNSAYSSTLKMEAICPSEISVDFQGTT
jgi:hypothetical protein